MRRLIIVLFALAAVTTHAAEINQNQARGFVPGHTSQSADIDTIDLANGNLTITLPVGGEYAIGEQLGYQLTLTYNGNLWDYNEVCPPNLQLCRLQALPNRRSNAGWGWLLSLGRLITPQDETNLTSDWIYEAPDGSLHPFKPSLHSNGPVYQDCGANPQSCAVPGVFNVWYTTDNSFLRLRQIDASPQYPDASWFDVEFPSGLVHRFDANGTLQIISDRFGNSLRLEYDEALGEWRLIDNYGRTNRVKFTPRRYDEIGMQSKSLVSSVDLVTVGGATATFTFTHDEVQTNRPTATECADTAFDTSATVTVARLTSLGLPDGSTYSMTYTAATGCEDAHLESVKLPTGGRVRWQYATWQFPQPEGMTSQEASSVGVTTRALLRRDGTTEATWSYAHELGDGSTNPPCPAPSMRTTITAPDGNMKRYFFVGYRLIGGFCSEFDYTLPFDPTQQDQGGRFLSSVTCGTSCSTPLRSNYVEYDSGLIPRRMKQSRTVFDDDSGCGATCAVLTVNESYDGFGHYRQKTVSSNFPDATSRVSKIDYNPGSSATALATTGQLYIGADAPWFPDTFGESSVTEEGSAAKAVTSFANGLTKDVRAAAAIAASPETVAFGVSDLKVARCRNSGGYVSSERYLGGDISALRETDPCSLAPLDGEYLMTHEQTFDSSGALIGRSSIYSGANLRVLDDVLDPSTGLITTDRDAAGLPTTFTYDSMRRLVSVTPPGEVATTYSYSFPTISSPNAPVSVTITRSDELTVQLFDDFGRLKRVKTQMPDGGWSARETNYDSTGRISSVSMPETIVDEATFSPSHRVTWAGYDAFGRAHTVTAPDGKVTSLSYAGARNVEQTSTRATSSNSNAAETSFTTRRTFDALGRLRHVTEAADTPWALSTDYAYDVGGRLASVKINAVEGAQQRTFEYDGRGFLKSETHPEIGANGNGPTAYSGYDARGHARRVITGGAIDVTYGFDSAERLVSVTETASGNLLKSFAYGTSNDPISCVSGDCDPRTGKMISASRHNRFADLDDVVATETYQYRGVGGRLSNRATVLANTPSFSGASFALDQTWSNKGELKTLTYPAMADVTRALTVRYAYTRGLPVETYPCSISASDCTQTGTYASATYRADGTIATVAHANGVLDTVDADSSGMSRPASINVSWASTPYWSSGTYRYDGTGSVAGIGTNAWAYDPLGRLITSAADSNGGRLSSSRQYDSFGNHLSSSFSWCKDAPNGQIAGTCEISSMLAAQMIATTNHFAGSTYDGAGNVISRGMDTFSYDVAGMTRSAVMGGRDFRYLYTADDERVGIVERVTSDGTTRNRTTWTLRSTTGDLLRVFDDDSTTGTRELRWREDVIWSANGTVLGSDIPFGIRHYSVDHLGSPRAITGASGSLLAIQDFGDFGEGGLWGSGSIQFTAQERDSSVYGNGATALPDSFHARMNDKQGRFLSPDPLLGNLLQSGSWNRYTYVMNDPLNYVDQDGMAMSPLVCDSNGNCSMDVTPGNAASAGHLDTNFFRDYFEWMYYSARTRWASAGSRRASGDLPSYAIASRIIDAATVSGTWDRFIDFVSPDSKGELAIELAMATIPELKAAKILDKTAEELIRGSLKASRSYRSELATRTYREIIAMSRKGGPDGKAAKQMKKLIEQSARLLEKVR